MRDVFVWGSGPEIIEGTADLRRDLFIDGGDGLLQRACVDLRQMAFLGRFSVFQTQPQILLDPFRVPVAADRDVPGERRAPALLDIDIHDAGADVHDRGELSR